jgi:hypothetical protein
MQEVLAILNGRLRVRRTGPVFRTVNLNGLRKTANPQEGIFPMSISRALLVVTVFFPPMIVCVAQTAATQTAATPTAASGGPAAVSSTPAAGSSFTPVAPSDILQHSLDEVRQTVGDLKMDKWKKGSVRDEAENNIGAIQRYMQGTLPALMKEGDAAPGTLSKVLPISRNVDALYNVLVHVEEASRVSAPADQVGQLQQAMADLEKARVAFGIQLQQTATMQEKQIVELHTTVQTQAASLKAAATPPPAPKCPVPPAPAKKKKAPAKSTTTPNTATPNTTTKPAAGTPANPPAKTQ